LPHHRGGNKKLCQSHETMPLTLIALGANLPDAGGRAPAATLRAAAAAIGRLLPQAETRLSRLYTSPAWPNPADPSYVNAVLRIDAAPDPLWLLGALNGIEAAFGRARGEVNAPRSLDLDIIAIGQNILPGPAPIIPHPRAHLRRFVLMPLQDVAPDWCHPLNGATVTAMLAGLPDDGTAALG
jgi:2-amino-4-hydroxy-6-hydroxymethyldihydropteridine diphosphokinase